MNKPKLAKSYNFNVMSGKKNKLAISGIHDDDTILYKTWEPKTDNRFIAKIVSRNDVEIPPYINKSITRPSCYYTKFGFKKYHPLIVSLYDPILETSISKLIESMDKNHIDINIKILGPVGDSVEEWQIKNAKLKGIKYSSFDWSRNGNASFIELVFDIKDVTLLY